MLTAQPIERKQLKDVQLVEMHADDIKDCGFKYMVWKTYGEPSAAAPTKATAAGKRHQTIPAHFRDIRPQLNTADEHEDSTGSEDSCASKHHTTHCELNG